MIKRALFVVAMMAGLGCGGSQKANPTADRCGAAATRVRDLFRGEFPGLSDPTIYDQLGQMIASHCASDAWSVASTTCITSSANVTELDACDQTFTEPQRTALRTDAQELMRSFMPPEEAREEAPDWQEGGAGAAPGGPSGGGGGDGADPCGGGE